MEDVKLRETMGPVSGFHAEQDALIERYRDQYIQIDQEIKTAWQEVLAAMTRDPFRGGYDKEVAIYRGAILKGMIAVARDQQWQVEVSPLKSYMISVFDSNEIETKDAILVVNYHTRDLKEPVTFGERLQAYAARQLNQTETNS